MANSWTKTLPICMNCLVELDQCFNENCTENDAHPVENKLCLNCSQETDAEEGRATMIHHYVLNAQGEPVQESDFLVWAQWMKTADRTVARDKIGHYTVSTVFLGLDHNFFGGPPLLYETIVFDDNAYDPNARVDSDLASIEERYTTRAAALEGHEKAVALVRDRGEEWKH